jgi:hypothetical protein
MSDSHEGNPLIDAYHAEDPYGLYTIKRPETQIPEAVVNFVTHVARCVFPGLIVEELHDGAVWPEAIEQAVMLAVDAAFWVGIYAERNRLLAGERLV